VAARQQEEPLSINPPNPTAPQGQPAPQREGHAPGSGRPEGGRPEGGRPEGGRPRRDYRSYNRRKVCEFCADHVKEIDYKDLNRLRRFVSERGRIEPRRKKGTCAKHQRRLTTAIKRARLLALLPYTPEHANRIGLRYP
jgi:small subunit ribosomal protein S18